MLGVPSICARAIRQFLMLATLCSRWLSAYACSRRLNEALNERLMWAQCSSTLSVHEHARGQVSWTHSKLHKKSKKHVQACLVVVVWGQLGVDRRHGLQADLLVRGQLEGASWHLWQVLKVNHMLGFCPPGVQIAVFAKALTVRCKQSVDWVQHADSMHIAIIEHTVEVLCTRLPASLFFCHHRALQTHQLCQGFCCT